MKKSFLALILLAQTGCTAVGLFAANLPSRFNDVSIERDVVFDPTHQLAMDIYRPPADLTGPHPVVVFFYGGRWQTGQKSDYAFVGSALAQRGFTVVIPDYRKYPEVRFPAFVEDGARAIAKTLELIPAESGNGRQVHLLGHSSGAHTATLLTADEHYLAAYGLDSHRVIRSVVGLSGPYDFVPEAEDVKDIFGPPDRFPLLRVSRYIEGHEPPMLLVQGADDKVVEQYNPERLLAAIRSHNGRGELKIYPDVDHVWTIASFTWLGRSNASILNDVVDFYNMQP